jgi:hypothetical protein
MSDAAELFETLICPDLVGEDLRRALILLHGSTPPEDWADAVVQARAVFERGGPEPGDLPSPANRGDLLGDTDDGDDLEGHPILDPWQKYVVPSFPLDTLPPVLRRFVRFQARNIGGDPSAIAMAALAACSGALDHRFAVKMMTHGDWWAHPRLWVALVGAVSSKKTPILSACLAPLRRAQSALAEQHRRELELWRNAAKSAQDKPREPAAPVRYIVNDVTVEKLAELLAQPDQERGLLVERDELAGWLGSMEKYSGGKGPMADRGFWLQAYNGGPYHVDRITPAQQDHRAPALAGLSPRLAAFSARAQTNRTGEARACRPPHWLLILSGSPSPRPRPAGGAGGASSTSRPSKPLSGSAASRRRTSSGASTPAPISSTAASASCFLTVDSSNPLSARRDSKVKTISGSVSPQSDNSMKWMIEVRGDLMNFS